MLVGVVIVISIPMGLGAARLGLSPAILGAIQGGLIGVVMPTAASYFFRRPYRQFIRQYLQGRGVPICLECGYDLRGQTEPRCSECGEAFDERLLRPLAPNLEEAPLD